VVETSSEKGSAAKITKVIKPSGTASTKKKPHQPLSAKTSYEIDIQDNARKMDTNLKGIEP
jgi:hypothetical protein